MGGTGVHGLQFTQKASSKNWFFFRVLGSWHTENDTIDCNDLGCRNLKFRMNVFFIWIAYYSTWWLASWETKSLISNQLSCEPWFYLEELGYRDLQSLFFCGKNLSFCGYQCTDALSFFQNDTRYFATSSPRSLFLLPPGVRGWEGENRDTRWEQDWISWSLVPCNLWSIKSGLQMNKCLIKKTSKFAIYPKPCPLISNTFW